MDIYNIALNLWYLIFFILVVLLYFKNSLEYKSEYKNKKIDHMPTFKGPHYLSYLLYKKIDVKAFISTFLILEKRGVITSKIEDSKLTFIRNDKLLNISKSQEFLLDMLFDEIGEENKFKLDDLSNYAKHYQGDSNFFINYQVWKKLMLKEVAAIKIYEDKSMFTIIRMYRNLTFIFPVLNCILKVNSFNGYFIILPAYFLMISFYNVYKRSIRYNDEYYKWLSYKSVLKESKDNNKLIYAILLGVSREYVNSSDTYNTASYQLYLAMLKLIHKSKLYGRRSIRDYRTRWR